MSEKKDDEHPIFSLVLVVITAMSIFGLVYFIMSTYQDRIEEALNASPTQERKIWPF